MNYKLVEGMAINSPLCTSLKVESRETFILGFLSGFEAATVQQDKKLKAYAAFINGNITRSELDDVLSNHSG